MAQETVTESVMGMKPAQLVFVEGIRKVFILTQSVSKEIDFVNRRDVHITYCDKLAASLADGWIEFEITEQGKKESVSMSYNGKEIFVIWGGTSSE